MLRFLIQSIPFNSKLNSLSDGILGFAVAVTQVPLGVGSIISRHPVQLSRVGTGVTKPSSLTGNAKHILVQIHSNLTKEEFGKKTGRPQFLA